jgi:hypothetical protein
MTPPALSPPPPHASTSSAWARPVPDKAAGPRPSSLSWPGRPAGRLIADTGTPNGTSSSSVPRPRGRA